MLRDMAFCPVLLGFCGFFGFTKSSFIPQWLLVERFIRSSIGRFTDEKSVLQQSENSRPLSFSPALFTMGTSGGLNHRLS